MGLYEWGNGSLETLEMEIYTTRVPNPVTNLLIDLFANIYAGGWNAIPNFEFEETWKF